MRPKDKNILDTLNLLVMLYRNRKNPLLKVPEVEQAKLLVTDEHLQMSNLTVPVFVNALDTLSAKGYVYFVSPFGKEVRNEIQRYQTSDDISKLMTEVVKHDTRKLTREMKEAAVTDIQRIMPKDMSLDVERLMNDGEMTFENMLREADAHVKTLKPDTVASVFILPFRSIERLYEKMNSGMKYDEVQDSGLWYDAGKYEFHFGDSVISTASRGTPTVAHFVLDALFNRFLKDMVVDYSDIVASDDFRGREFSSKRYSDGIRHFVSKNPQIADVFSIYSDRVEVAQKYRAEIH